MSARGGIVGLDVRTPIGQMLPSLYHDDEMAQGWCAGLDEVLAPVPATLDSFWAYLDPQLAPVDFVEWLAAWVGLELDQTWTIERRRALVAAAHRIHDARGTLGGLADLIELYVGVRPELADSGGVTWSATPGSALPGRATPEVVVTVRPADPGSVDPTRLESLVEFAKPAHVRHRIEFDSPPPAPRTRRAAATPPPPPPPGAPAAGPGVAPPPPPPGVASPDDEA